MKVRIPTVASLPRNDKEFFDTLIIYIVYSVFQNLLQMQLDCQAQQLTAHGQLPQLPLAEAVGFQQQHSVDCHGNDKGCNKGRNDHLRQLQHQRVNAPARRAHDKRAQQGDDECGRHIPAVVQLAGHRAAVQRAHDQREHHVADQQRPHAEALIQQHQNQHNVDRQGNGRVEHRRHHMVRALQNRGGDGGQGVEHSGGGARRQQIGRQIMVFAQSGEQHGHNGLSQNSQPHRAGNGNGHIEFHRAGDLMMHLPHVLFHMGRHNAGHQRHSHGGADGYRQVYHLIVLRVEHALHGGNGGGIQRRRVHKAAEHHIVNGVADLVDRLAEHDGQNGQKQRLCNQRSVLLMPGRIPPRPQADLRHAPEHVTCHEQEGCDRAGQRTQCAAHGAPGGGLGRCSVHVHKRPGRHDADGGVEALIHHLRDGRGHHGAGALGVTAHHAEECKQEGRGRQHPQGSCQSRRMVQVLQQVSAEIQQAEGKRTHDQSEQQRHGQHMGGVAILSFCQPGGNHLGHRRGQAHGGKGQGNGINTKGDGVNAVALIAQQIRHGDAVEKADQLCKNTRRRQNAALKQERILCFFRHIVTLKIKFYGCPGSRAFWGNLS